MLKAPSAEPQPSEHITNLFNDLLEHQAFKSAPVLRSILLYLWQHQSESVSEYSIAVDALGRSPNFDSKTDASVRVLIGRLRARLKEFNATESFPLKLNIPVGTHEVHWHLDDAPGPLVSPIIASPWPYRGFFYGMTVLVMALAVLCTVLFQQNRKLGASDRSSNVQVPRFWRSFLIRGTSPVIVLPSPVHFFWPEKNMVARDLTVADFADWSKSATVRELAKRWGAPRLTQRYVGLVDMQGGVQLLNYFDTLGFHADLIDSGHFQSDGLGAKSTIFVGFPNRTAYLSLQLENTNFYLSDSLSGPVVVSNRNPTLGQPAEYREIDYSNSHKILPGLIVLPPATSDGSRTLILLGMVPMGIATMLVSQSGLERLDEEWRNAGSPKAWEMVVQEEINQNTVLKVWPVAIRAIPSAR